MANDHFSLQSREYVRYRPVYPSALFRWLARQAPRLGCAWDSATGNGQGIVHIGTSGAEIGGAFGGE